MRVVWTQTAKKAVDQIFDYIARDNPRAAESVAHAIMAAGDSLSLWPKRNRNRGGGLRFQSVRHTKYMIYYRIESHPEADDRVMILTVRHGAQDQQSD